MAIIDSTLGTVAMNKILVSTTARLVMFATALAVGSAAANAADLPPQAYRGPAGGRANL